MADEVQAVQAAAESGDQIAQAKLGTMYVRGRGVPQDYVKAVTWFRLAAEQGNANAQYNLGYAYGTGAGVAKDHINSFRW